MSIVTSVATASYRYYMNKKKQDIIYRLQMLHRAVYDEEPGDKLVQGWYNQTKAQLADRAMCYHRGLPSE